MSRIVDTHGSKLMLDKKDFGYNFSCNGSGRDGTYDISAWEDLTTSSDETKKRMSIYSF
jgi:Photosystem I psaA/psaB protein